jgi:hypothetical protein
MKKILLHGSKLIEASQIPYLLSALTFFNESRCVLNTQFYVSHEEINKIIFLFELTKNTETLNMTMKESGLGFFLKQPRYGKLKAFK